MTYPTDLRNPTDVLMVDIQSETLGVSIDKFLGKRRGKLREKVV